MTSTVRSEENASPARPRAIRAMQAASVVGALLVAGPAAAQLGTPVPKKPLGEPASDTRGPQAFLENQLSFERVLSARENVDGRMRALFEEKGVAYPSPEVFIRVFKHERVLELWAGGAQGEPLTLIKTYPVCAQPGQLGPKRQMGDVQVPEGFYFIDDFNPTSNYHLSLRVSYPNTADRLRREAISLGGDIFIHGGCETVGCVPIENDNIEEVYWVAAQATAAGQQLIPLHIFPSRLGDDGLRWLESTFNPSPELLAFWKNLAEGYRFFEQSRAVPWVTVARDGSYSVPAAALAADAEPDTTEATTVKGGAPADSTAAADSTANGGGSGSGGGGG